MTNPHDGGAMTPTRFIAKWPPVTLAERAASQEHIGNQFSGRVMGLKRVSAAGLARAASTAWR
jgi:hypothetical protein